MVNSSATEVRISGDSHVSEPPDLWVTRMPEKYRDQALTFPQLQFGRGNYAREGGFNPEQRLKDQAFDGISAEVLFPTQGMKIYQQFHNKPVDVELSHACERAYNDWMIEFCSYSPERLWGQAFISLYDIDYAIAEMQRTKDAGLKGVTVWVAPPESLPWTGKHYERFWSAAEDFEVTVAMHINSGFGVYSSGRGDDRYEILTRQAFGHKIVAMRTVTELILSGVFERHPRLKVLIAEFECGWIPFFLEDLDRKFGRGENLGLTKMPSEYFTESIYSTFMQDGVTGYLLERWGADNFIYSNDYPHPGGVWPHSDDTVALTMDSLPGSTRENVLANNVAKLYRQPLPTPVERPEKIDFDEAVWTRPWLKRQGEFTFAKSHMGLSSEE